VFACVADSDDDDGDDDDLEGSSDGSGQGQGHSDNVMMTSHHDDSRYGHRHRQHMSPPVPRFNPHVDDQRFVDPSLRLKPHRTSTRRRPVMYTAASVAGPVIYTTPDRVYFTRARNYGSNLASTTSLSSLSSLVLTLATVAHCSWLARCTSLSAVS